MAVGLLSIPTPPRLKGVEKFKGRSFHTYYWPQEPVEMAGKKVAVIGTGATGIQAITEIAKGYANGSLDTRPSMAAAR